MNWLPLASVEVLSDAPIAWVFGIPAIMGSVGIAFYQFKKDDSVVKTLAKIVIGFGFGFFGGSYASTKLGVDRFFGTFICAVGSPGILAGMEGKMKAWFTK